jgi:hypothetical protein
LFFRPYADWVVEKRLDADMWIIIYWSENS